ncbi:hypothetical protein KL86PLE_30283 [uncultured Pleomorphomonas sp.]|uniref:Uncharacterized protein n=1 Tax=uncultured Pleomorphomonas sp. TaxID=442121 RepID=A0A212LE38_9HYPH|nr:hypothetical protein KL86PLE_30283 [uncultured Pleomorphomonas sp.]
MAISSRRPAPTRVAPFSYFWTCWKVTPSAVPSFSWEMPRIMRRMRMRAPTCTSAGFGTFFLTALGSIHGLPVSVSGPEADSDSHVYHCHVGLAMARLVVNVLLLGTAARANASKCGLVARLPHPSGNRRNSGAARRRHPKKKCAQDGRIPSHVESFGS